MKTNYTVYILHFLRSGKIKRIAYAKWDRIRAGKEAVIEYSNQSIYIAYAYILIKNRKPDYCPRIDGAIYYFDSSGRIILDKPHYLDILQDLEEGTGGVISLQHHKNKKDEVKIFHWKLKPQQIQAVINYIW